MAGAYVSANIRGKRGQAISVEEDNSPLISQKIGQTDVFGKPFDESSATNPYIKVVVKMDEDDLLVGTTGYFGGMLGRTIQLASHVDAMKKEVDENLSRLIGKTLYNTGYTNLLNPNLSLQDLLDPRKRRIYRDYRTKNLTPLKVVDVKFLEEENAVIIKVNLPKGESRILFSKLDNYNSEVRSKETILERMQLSAVEKIPSKFSPREVSAIKEGNIFRGMSEDALRWSWGYAEKINDWGRGGKQYVYSGGQYVYVSGKFVRDWQSVN